MTKQALEEKLGIDLKAYQTPNWAEFRGDHHSQSCICDEAENVVGLILKGIELVTLELPILNELVYCCISDNEKLESLAFQGDLSNLKHLDISDNQLKELEIPTNLSQLEYLYAANNKLEILRLASNFSNIRLIDLSNNNLLLLKIESPMPKLEYLYLRKNAITTFDFIELPNLQILDLEENALEQLPANFLTLEKLDTLYLNENPLNNIPDTVLGTGERHNSSEEVMIYLKSMATSEAESIITSERGKGMTSNIPTPLHQAKMVLVGNGEVGKSSIKVKLLDRAAPLPKKEERTPGLDIAPYLIKDLPTTISKLDQPIDFELNIWDFGGQGKYREIQQLFCNPKTLYLFVTAVDDVPTKEDYIGFEYWLSMVNAYSYDATDKHFAPVIHVLNKIDILEDVDYKDKTNLIKGINENDYLAQFSNINQFIKLSCETLDNFDTLEKGIQKVLPEVNKKIFTDVFPGKWMEVKSELEKLHTENHIDLETYFSICEQYEMSQEEGKIWLRILDRAGVVIYFGENDALNNWIIINPIWIKDALCKVIDSPFIKNGILYPTDFKHIWPNPPFSIEEHEKLIALMLAYKLCYQQENEFSEIEFIVPALLRAKKPEFPAIINRAPDLQIKLAFVPFIPAGTVNKLMVDLKKSIYNQLKWKNNVVIQDAAQNAYAHIREDWATKAVYIDYFGTQSKDLHYLLITAFSRINETLKNTRFLHQLNFDILVKQGEKWYTIDTLKEFNVKKYAFLWENDLKKSKEEQPKNNSQITKETNAKQMDRIRDLIAKGKLDQALTLLSEQYNSNEITLLQGRIKKLNRDNRMGILTNSEANLERNKITAATLDLLTELAKEKEEASSSTPTRDHQEPEKIKPKTEVNRGGGKRIFPKETSNIIEIEGAAPNFIPFKEMEEKVKILFISATPTSAQQLNVARESRFKDLFRYFDKEDIFELKEEHGVNANQFFNFLIDEKPHILHYGGHGEVEGIVLEGGNLEADILKNLLKISNQTQCVVLNACYSVTIAKKVAESVPYVIGTQGTINDKTAIAFAMGFYIGIVAGYTIEAAFQFGLLKIQQEKLPNADIPILVKGVKKKEG